MTRYLLLLLFFIMLAAPALGLEVSIAPGLSVKNALLYAVVGGIAVEWAIAKNRRLESLPILVPFIALVAYGFFTWLVIVLVVHYPGYDPIRTFILFKAQFADHLFVFLAFFYGATKRNDALWLIRVLVWMVIASNILTVIDGLNIPDLGIVIERRDGRMGGLIGDSNDYGVFVAFFLPAAIALFLSSSFKMRLLAGVGVLASIVGLAISASRGAYVAAVVGSVLATWYLRAHIPRKTILQYGVVFALICIVAVIGVLNTEYRDLLLDRFSQTQSGQLSNVSSGRTDLWIGVLDRMSDHPTSFITGYGWQAYEHANFVYAPHNRYLGLLFNVGLIGLALYLITAANVLKLIRNAITLADQETKPFLIASVFGFSSMLVSLLFSDVFNPWIFIWAFCGLAVRVAADTVAKVPPATKQVGLRSEIVRSKGPAWQGTIARDSAAKRLSP